MSYMSIKVSAYSGHRGNERPLSLVINDETMTVVEILDKWIEEGFYGRVRKRFFIVKTDNNHNYKIFIDETSSEWFCEIK
jgi:hypothetical protein